MIISQNKERIQQLENEVLVLNNTIYDMQESNRRKQIIEEVRFW